MATKTYRLIDGDREDGYGFHILTKSYQKRQSLSGSSLRTRAERIAAASTPLTAALPLPDNLKYNLQNEWSVDDQNSVQAVFSNLDNTKEALTNSPYETLSNVLTRFTGVAASPFGGRKLLQDRYGKAVDPLKEIFYQGVTHRTFTFSWNFAPKNSTEAANIIEFAETLMKASAPSKDQNAGGLLNLPDTFEISFGEKLKLPKIGDCVCTSVEYDPFASGQIRHHEDGYPAFISLTLEFTELEIRTKDNI